MHRERKRVYHSVIRLLSYSIIGLLLASCAQQVALTGGEQDVTPPGILKQEPPNYTTGFKEKSVRIYFDEYIELVNPSETFLISPPLKQQPEYMLRGKSLVITLNNELEENTTYIITCDNGIKDLREGNFLPLTTLVYSTGDYIDSLSLVGTVRDAFTLAEQEKIGVLLHRQDEDSVMLKNLPYYYTTTNKQGNFTFTNIAEGEYQLYALLDKNRNYIFDQSDEKIAFCDELVKPIYIPPIVNETDTTKVDSTDINTLETDFPQIDSTEQDSTNTPRIDYSKNTLMLFTEQDTTLRFLKREFKGNYRHEFAFKNEISDFRLNQVSNLDTIVNYLTEYNKTNDTISIYLTSICESMVDFELYANERLLDTISFNPSQKGSSRRALKKADTAVNYLTYTVVTKGELHKHPCILFASPVDVFDLTQCILVEEQKDQSDTLSIECYFTDSNRRSLAFKYPFKEKTKYSILCRDSVFFSHHGAFNDSMKIDFTTKSSKDYGAIRISYQFYEGNNFIVQLLTDKLDVVQEDFLTFNKTINYNHLSGGKYRLRVIVDDNNNKKWDTGNFNARQQPEKIIYFDKVIDPQPNWKIEETFEVIVK